MPKNIRYIDKDGEEIVDDGCGCLSFAILEDRKCGYYVRYEDNYINLNPKEAKTFEEQIKRDESVSQKKIEDDPYGYIRGEYEKYGEY